MTVSVRKAIDDARESQISQRTLTETQKWCECKGSRKTENSEKARTRGILQQAETQIAEVPLLLSVDGKKSKLMGTRQATRRPNDKTNV